MSGRRAVIAAPPGYERFAIGDATVVALRDAVVGLQEALHVCRTLHGWAATSPGATAHLGRATTWGARLPSSDIDMVVRHSRRGGLMAAIIDDLFISPSRAPWELQASLRLRAAGVATPELVAYLLYPAAPGLCRSDVATRRLPPGDDFPAAWQSVPDAEHESQLAAIGDLLRDLQRAGAHHPDLNAKNIYLVRDETYGTWKAFALDLDRVQFVGTKTNAAGAGNAARLRRSLLKWRTKQGLVIADSELAMLDAAAGSRP